MNCVCWLFVLHLVYLISQMDARFIFTDEEIEWTEIEETVEVFNCSSALKRNCPTGYCCTAVEMISEDVDWGVCSKYKEIGERCVEKLLPGGLTCPCAQGLTCRPDPFSKIFSCDSVALYQGPWGMFKEQM